MEIMKIRKHKIILYNNNLILTYKCYINKILCINFFRSTLTVSDQSCMSNFSSQKYNFLNKSCAHKNAKGIHTFLI